MLHSKKVKRAIVLPNGFRTVPDVVNIDELESYKEDFSIRLVRNILKNTRFFGKNRKFIVVSFFAKKTKKAKINTRLIPVHSKKPSYYFDDSISSLMFSQDQPLIGIVADFLRVSALAEHYKSNVVANDQIAFISWGNIIASFLREYDIYTIEKSKIDIKNIKQVSNLFQNSLQDKATALPISSKNNEITFLESLYKFLSQYYVFNFASRSAKLVNPDAIKVSFGSAQRAITPYTFANCGQGCKFCYVDRGSAIVYYPYKWARPLKEIKQVMKDYNPTTKKGLPQLRFTMMDWEPTEHPQFVQVLKAIAKRDHYNQIPITTHGGNLNAGLLKKIAKSKLLKNLVLFQVSLNSANLEMRKKIMPGAPNQYHLNAINSLKIMHELGIAFDVSLVAATNFIPLEDILNSIQYADKYKPHTFIRVTFPGATRHHDKSLLLPPEELARIDAAAVAFRKKLKNRTPVVLSVGLLNRQGLKAEIEDILPGSAADKAGIKSGCIINTINKIVPRSRTEATLLLLDLWKQHEKGKKISIIIKYTDQNGKKYCVDLGKHLNKYPRKKLRCLGEKFIGEFGLLLHDEIDFNIFTKIAFYQKTHKFQRPCIVTSKVMKPFFKEAKKLLYEGEKVRNLSIISADNVFFGGNVCIAGLLTFSDIKKSINKLKVKPDCIFISASMLTRGNYDLMGYHLNDFSSSIGIPVVPLRARTGSL